jgi:MFS family permease
MNPIAKSSRRLFALLYFTFGLSIMCWVPRFSEVKRHLGLSNGEFGTIISTGAFGVFFALLIVGHVVHAFGVRIILLISGTWMCVATAAITWITSPVYFLLLNITIGGSISAFNTAITAQALAMEKELKRSYLPKMSGFFAVGTLATTLIAAIAAKFLSVQIHAAIVIVFSLFSLFYIVKRLSPILIPADKSDSARDAIRLAQFYTSFKIDWPVNLGLLFGSLLAFSAGDWASIYNREELGLPKGLGGITFFIFTVGIILGQLKYAGFEKKYSMVKLVKYGGIVGGVGMGIGVVTGRWLSDYSAWSGVALASLGFFMGGLGCSFMGPIFVSQATKRSKLPASVAIAQLNSVNTLIVFVSKIIISLTAQLTSVTVALLIPCALLIFTGAFLRKDS